MNDFEKIIIQYSALLAMIPTIAGLLKTKFGQDFIEYIAATAAQGLQKQIDCTNDKVKAHGFKINSLETVTQLHASKIRELQKDTDKNTDNITELFKERGK